MDWGDWEKLSTCSAAFLAPNVAIRHGVRVLREPGRVPILAAAYGPSKQCAHLAVVRSHAVLRNRLRLAVMEARATRQAEGINPLRASAQRRYAWNLGNRPGAWFLVLVVCGAWFLVLRREREQTRERRRDKKGTCGQERLDSKF